MNINLLIFFALPLATIILAVVLQKILKNPLLVAVTFFAIYLIVSFAVATTAQLVYAIVATIVYSIIAYITALLVKLACKLRGIFDDRNDCCRCRCNNQENNDNGTNLLTISSNCGNGNSNDLLTISSNCSRSSNEEDDENIIDDECCCNCNSSNTENVVLNASVTPNVSNNGRTGSFRGCYRRRF